MLFVAGVGLGVDHEHLVYITQQTAECGSAEGHVHPVSVDPGSGQVIVGPAENHTHPIIAYTPDMYDIPDVAPDFKDKTEEDIVAEKADLFQQAWDMEQESIEAGRESVKFREGDQWPEEVKKSLIAKKRACLTINHVAPMVETLSGMYRRNRSDLRCFPKESGDADIANVLTYVLKHIMQTNCIESEEVEVFEDAIVPGRGIFEVYPDFDVDLRGQLKIRHTQWDAIVFGPHQRKDLEDCEYFCRWKWLSQDMLENMFPDKIEDISKMFGRFEQFIAGTDDLSDLGTPLTSSLFADRKSREMRLVELEEKVYYRLKVHIDPMSGFTVSDADLPVKFRSQLKKMSLRTLERKLHKIRKTVMCGDVLVEDAYVERPIAPECAGPNFSVFPVYAYKRGARFEGKVERIKDPQLEINKRRSQIIDIVNTSINNGWLVPKNAFGSAQERKKFKETVSTPGFVIDVPDMEQLPQKIESSRVEPAIVQLELNSLQSFRETSNVNSEMLGVGNQYQSGSAMAHRMQQGLMGNEYLFDNMSQVKRRLGREILLWIQQLYTADRIARLFFDQAKLEKIYMGDNQEVDPYDVQLYQHIETKLKDSDLTHYDVTIGETGQSPTAQLANFDMMMELAGKGVQLPPQLFIELAPIPNKARIMQILEQSMQQQAESEQKKYDTEIRKTVIAAESKRQS